MQPGRTGDSGNQQSGQRGQPPQIPPLPRQQPATSGGPAMGLPALPGVPPGFSGIQPNAPFAPPARGPAMPAQSRMPARSGANPNALPAPITPAVAPSLGRVSSVPMPPPSQPGQPSDGMSPGATGPRKPTLTQQMRSVQPPDVARQAMSELGVLARELATLPEELAAAGLARGSAGGYFEATQIYLGLARQAWESVAEERLEQSGAEPEYRQRAIAVARRVSQLQQECRTVTVTPEFPIPRRTPPFWDRRVGLVRKGLLAFQEHLSPTPEAQDMGRGLFRLRGYIGLASAAGLELGLLSVLTSGVIVLLALLGVGLLLQLVGAAIIGAGTATTTAGIELLGIVLLDVLVAALLVRGPHPLPLLLGAAVFSPSRSTRNGRSGSPLAAALLRSWWILTGLIGALGIISSLAYGGTIAVAQAQGQAPSDLAASLTYVGTIITTMVAPAAGISLACLLLLAIPTLLLALVRFAAEVVGGPGWIPGARRYTLDPALTILAPFTALCALGLWLGSQALGLDQSTLFTFSIGTLVATVTLRGVVLVLALILPYLLVLDMPYRLGMRRWGRAWMADLTVRRADVESHVRRLSVSDPQSGAQNTSDENLRAMQYDLVLLQFYRDKIAEAARTSGAPFGASRYIVALIVVLAAAFLLDGLGASLAQLLLPR